ncbi:LysM domain-containing protein [Geobacillus stearothermophilus]|nr:LysM domain-containing protein [Geobacillus stearothermophilus]
MDETLVSVEEPAFFYIKGKSQDVVVKGGNERGSVMIVHVVKRGETLWQLAQRYGVPLERIVAANELSDPNRLAPFATGRPSNTMRRPPRRFTAIQMNKGDNMKCGLRTPAARWRNLTW